MNKLTWWNRAAFLSLFIGAAILAFALTLQPKISDDMYFIWHYAQSAGAIDNIATLYMGSTGRIWLILLSTFVLPHPAVASLYRAFIVIEIALLVALAWYCARGPGAWRRTRENGQALAIFGCLLWLALPARNETVAWMVGNFAYFVPALFCLAFMAWTERALSVTPAGNRETRWHRLTFDGVSFMVGLCVGVSHEQVVAACCAYLVLTALRVKFDRPLERRKMGARVWIGVLGLLVGTAILVGAPGNYLRLGALAAPTLPQVIERMMLYVPAAFFEIGTGDTGKNIWLGVLVFALLYLGAGGVRDGIREGLKRGAFWWIVSLATLLAMTPITNFISPRTTFFAVIFLFIGFAAMTGRASSIEAEATGNSDAADGSSHSASAPNFALSTAVLTILAFLVSIEALAGLISNASVTAEFARRDKIVEQAKHSAVNGGGSLVRVPFIATETSALTYIQNPDHDRAFLANWGSHIGLKIVQDCSDGAPLPYSFKPLKAIKFNDNR